MSEISIGVDMAKIGGDLTIISMTKADYDSLMDKLSAQANLKSLNEELVKRNKSLQAERDTLVYWLTCARDVMKIAGLKGITTDGVNIVLENTKLKKEVLTQDSAKSGKKEPLLCDCDFAEYPHEHGG